MNKEFLFFQKSNCKSGQQIQRKLSNFNNKFLSEKCSGIDKKQKA